jgi:hypothetical protein
LPERPLSEATARKPLAIVQPKPRPGFLEAIARQRWVDSQVGAVQAEWRHALKTAALSGAQEPLALLQEWSREASPGLRRQVLETGASQVSRWYARLREPATAAVVHAVWRAIVAARLPETAHAFVLRRLARADRR